MEKTLRIAIIRQRYTPFGGAERFVENALNALQHERSIELTLITRKWKGADNPNIKKIICNPFYLGRLWRDWSFARTACRAVNKENFDLVQSHERVPCGDIYRAGDGVHREWLKQWFRLLPLWRQLTIKLSPYHNYLLWQERRVFESPHLKTIIVNSTQIGNEIKVNFPKSRAKVELIYNGVDNEKFTLVSDPHEQKKIRNTLRTKLDIPTNSTVLLFVGSGFERKGVPLLLQLMKELPLNIHLVIIGKDRRMRRLQLECIQNGTSDRMHFLGAQQNLIGFYQAADLFLFPTLYDPLPNVVLEAMASGLPALVSNSCGAREVVTEDIDGTIQDPLDLNLWRDALLNILDSQEGKKLTKMGHKAREKALQFSVNNMVDKLSTLYRES